MAAAAKAEARQQLIQSLQAGAYASDYLRFRYQADSKSGKTQVWLVISNHHGNLLGQIKWWPQWRQYCFWPAIDSLFNRDCLLEIGEVVEVLSGLHKDPSGLA